MLLLLELIIKVFSLVIEVVCFLKEVEELFCKFDL